MNSCLQCRWLVKDMCTFGTETHELQLFYHFVTAGSLVPRHVKRITLGHVPLDVVCDVVKLFEHVEELTCQSITAAQEVCLSKVPTQSHKCVN